MASELRTAAPGTEAAVESEQDAPIAPGTGGRSRAAGLLRAARPKQWVKNVLLLAAPFAAGALGDGPTLARVLLAVAAFCLAASGTYLLNDVRDVDEDRRHPRKCRRPIAAGVVSPRLAVAAGVTALGAGLAVAALVGWELLAILALYVVTTTAYSLWLRNVAVVDIGIVAFGFILRAVAGGVAADVPLSRWFLIVASFGSLFMVAGKRYGEYLDLGADRASIRPTLRAYSHSYLRYVWTVASAVAIAAYCLWAFEESGFHTGPPWYELSIIPFTMSILRYALLLDDGDGSAPEEIVLRDRTLQVLGVVWVVVFGCGVYFG